MVKRHVWMISDTQKTEIRGPLRNLVVEIGDSLLANLRRERWNYMELQHLNMKPYVINVKLKCTLADVDGVRKNMNNGYWNELSEQCRCCINLHTFSAHMDGNNTYCCGKYPLQDNNILCPEFNPIIEEVIKCPFKQQLAFGEMVCDDGSLGCNSAIQQCPTIIFNKCQAGYIDC